jgi:hypothetical protein
MQKVTSTANAPAVSLTAARLAFASGAATLALLAVLHILSPEFNPAWRMVSEYALGHFGWVLALMFIAWALNSAALFFALRPHVRTAGGKIGLSLLLIAALGMAMAAFFDVRHSLHGLATLLGNPTFVIAAVLINVSLARTQAWKPARRSLLWTANLPWVSLIVMMAAVLIGLENNGGKFGAEMLVGWPNRLLILAYCVWMMTAAWWANRLDR